MKFRSVPSVRRPAAGFTLIELLVVIGIIAVLAAMLLPVLGKAKIKAHAISCMSNTKQLTLGWIMFSTDNQEKLMPNPAWCGGTMTWGPDYDNINTDNLMTNVMGDYCRSYSVYKCPGDRWQSPANPGPRVRSVAMNGSLGNSSGPTAQGTAPDGRTYFAAGAAGTGKGAQKTSDLLMPGPARIYVVLDEHPDSINDGTFMFDVGYQKGAERWRDLPATHHANKGSFSFADGHSEIRKWLEVTGINKTVYPVLMNDVDPWKAVNLGISRDYEWMQEGMPFIRK